MHNTIFTLLLLLSVTFTMEAQFYTIQRESVPPADKEDIEIDISEDIEIGTDTVSGYDENEDPPTIVERKTDRNVFKKLRKLMPRKRKKDVMVAGMPDLTIPNLIREMRYNNIKYPEVVLAQAILETGWFTSNVCRTKNNLFGLTNPRTKEYYSFNHWTESVKAYYTKVQYRYKGGDYLLWLRDIGYAEAPNYIQSVIRVMKQLRKKDRAVAL